MGDVGAAQPLGDPLGHLLAEVGEVEAGQPAVEHPGRVVHLAVAQHVHDGGLGHPLLLRGGGCGGSGGVRQGVRDPREGGVVVRRGDEPGLERGRRQVDAALEHGVEERGVAEGLLRRRARVVDDGVRPEEHREHAARVLQPVRQPRPPTARRRPARRARPLPCRRGRRRRRSRPAGSRARRRSRPGSRTACRPGRPARPGRGGAITSARPPNAAAGSPPPITLPKVIRSGAHAVEAEPAGPADPEAGHHLVADEQRAVRPAQLGQPGVEAGQRRDDAHVAGGRLGDDAGDLAVVHPERLGHRGEVVVGDHDRVGRGRTGDARGVRQAERRDAGPGRGQQRVDVAVVAAGELHHLGAAGEAAGQPDRRHGGLGAAGHQPHLLDRLDPVDDLLGERDLALGRRAERRALRHRRVHRVDDRRVGVPEQQRPPRADQVDVLAAVGVDDVRRRGRGP